MGIDNLMNVAVQQGVWAVLFVWLLVETRKEAQKREDKLYEQITKYDETLEQQGQALTQITSTLVSINADLQDIKDKIEK